MLIICKKKNSVMLEENFYIGIFSKLLTNDMKSMMQYIFIQIHFIYLFIFVKIMWRYLDNMKENLSFYSGFFLNFVFPVFTFNYKKY